MGGVIRKALIYFSFYIRSVVDLVVAKRKFITSALVKRREHATMKPALWSVAGNLPFLRDVRFSLFPLSTASRIKFLCCPLVSLFFGQRIYEKFLASSKHIFFFRVSLLSNTFLQSSFHVFQNGQYVIGDSIYFEESSSFKLTRV